MKKVLYHKKIPADVIKWLIPHRWVQIEVLRGHEKGMRRPARCANEMTPNKKVLESELTGASLSKILKKLPPVQF